MAARRNVLHGASAGEREERASQQREYAALLQEQIRQKNARHDAERAYRAQQQQAERDMMDRSTQPPPSHQSLPSPSRSPKRAASMPYPPPASTSSDASGSPSRSLDVYSQQPSDNALPYPTADGAQTTRAAFLFPANLMASAPTGGSFAASAVAAFTPGPPVFESLLRDAGLGGASTAKFNDELAAFNRLTSEVQSLARQRRMRVQSYVRPSFLLRAETPAMPSFSEHAVERDLGPNNYEDGGDEGEGCEPSPQRDHEQREPLAPSPRHSAASFQLQIAASSRDLGGDASRLRSSHEQQPLQEEHPAEGDESDAAPLATAPPPPSPPLPAQRRARAAPSPPKARVATPELALALDEPALDDPELLQDTHSEMLLFEPTA